MKKMIWLFACFVAALAAFIAVVRYYSMKKLEVIEQQVITDEYSRYYVLVTDNSSIQTESLYQAAKERAAETGVYLDLVRQSDLRPYSTEEKLAIAAAQKADGIILDCKTPVLLTDALAKVSDAGIPVVNVLSDDASSGRVSYIGLNSYEVGEAYGEEVLNVLKPGNSRILVLVNTDSETVLTSMIYSRMLQVLDDGCGEDRSYEVSAVTVNSYGAFEAEEKIRDIFINSEGVPDVLVCLDSVTTECAIQAVTDYNKVGNTVIVGYYTSSDTLGAIPKGIVSATLAVDMTEIGRLAVDALNEYLDYGYVSIYFPVSFEMVTAKNVRNYEDGKTQ